MGIHTVIDVLEIVILIVGILTLGRLFFTVGDVRAAVLKLEDTRVEISSTLKKIETVADSTDKVLREELTPTLKAARETLANVEVSTRAIAETTIAARKLAGSLESVQSFFTVGGPIVQALAKKVSGGAGGFFSGISAGIKSVLGHKSVAAKKSASSSAAKTIQEEIVVIPAGPDHNPVLAADNATKPAARPSKKS